MSSLIVLFLRRLLFTVLIQAATIRVDLNIIITGMAEYFCIHVAAAVTPEVKFTAIYTEGNPAAVTENDGRDFPAP
jgi:hypothetical protein